MILLKIIPLLITIHFCPFGQSEFLVTRVGISYLNATFATVDEEIFPSDIQMNISISKFDGILLHSIDANRNELIMSLYNDINYVLTVQFRGNEKNIFLKDLCGCDMCLYTLLCISVRITDKIILKCNGRKDFFMKFEKPKSISQDNEMMKLESKDGKNNAILWLVNTPQSENLYPNNDQIEGCIFNVEYKGTLVDFMIVGPGIRNKCERTCNDCRCGEGVCYETYSTQIHCDCTNAFGSGRECEDESKQINAKYIQTFQFSSIKVSWNSNEPLIFELGNEKMNIKLETKNENLTLTHQYFNFQTTVINLLTTKFVGSSKNIIQAWFNNDTVKINQMEPSVMHSLTNIGKEFFDYLIILSGSGTIDLVYKSQPNEVSWKRVPLNEENAITPERTTDIVKSVVLLEEKEFTDDISLTKSFHQTSVPPIQKGTSAEQNYWNGFGLLNDVYSICFLVIILIISVVMQSVTLFCVIKKLAQKKDIETYLRTQKEDETNLLRLTVNSEG